MLFFNKREVEMIKYGGRGSSCGVKRKTKRDLTHFTKKKKKKVH